MVNAWLQTTYIRISQLEIKTYVKEVDNLCTFCILVLNHTIFIKFQKGFLHQTALRKSEYEHKLILVLDIIH